MKLPEAGRRRVMLLNGSRSVEHGAGSDRS